MYSTDLAHVHDNGFSAASAGLASQVLRLLRSRAIRKGLIVEVGCGSGRLAHALTQSDFEVLGFDVSPAMIRLARQNAPRARFRVGSVVSMPLGPCQVVLGVGEVMTYVPGGLRALAAFFRRVYAALSPGGVFVFDFVASAAQRVYRDKTVAGDGWTITVSASFDERSRKLTRRIVTVRTLNGRQRRSLELHRVRVYDPNELREALEACGFTVAMGRTIGRAQLLPGNVAVIATKRRSPPPSNRR